jgi:hypothetical protein
MEQTAHPRRFEWEIYNQLDGYDFRILEYLMYLCKIQAKKSPTGARYAYPSEAHLASKLDTTRETISRHVSKLSRLGVIAVTHRRKVRGHWQTNLYRIVSHSWWKVQQVIALLRGKHGRKGQESLTSTPQLQHQRRENHHRVTQSSHLAIPVRENNNRMEEKGGPSGNFVSLRDAIKALQPALFRRMYEAGS